MKNLLPSLMIFTILALVSCKPKGQEKITFSPNFTTYRNDSTGKKVQVKKKETNYGLLTPIEVCAIFNRMGVPYNNATLNPTSNKNLYLSSSKAAINTGIYGVDFEYLKLFGMGQPLIDYMLAIKDLSNKLNIPDALITDPIRKVQNDLSDSDTVTVMMQKAYNDIENHLRQSGRESTAGLMIMGGWVEAMFIATQLVYNPDNPDAEVVEKIAEQKYTLNSLLSYMKNYYDDPVVVYYTKKLKFLQHYFDTFDIYFEKGDLEIDVAHQVLRSSGAKMTITIDTLNDIRDYIAMLRTEMVTV
jgi:hypothetical protein